MRNIYVTVLYDGQGQALGARKTNFMHADKARLRRIRGLCRAAFFHMPQARASAIGAIRERRSARPFVELVHQHDAPFGIRKCEIALHDPARFLRSVEKRKCYLCKEFAERSSSSSRQLIILFRHLNNIAAEGAEWGHVWTAPVGQGFPCGSNLRAAKAPDGYLPMDGAAPNGAK